MFHRMVFFVIFVNVFHLLSVSFLSVDITVVKELNQEPPIREQMRMSVRLATSVRSRPQSPRSVPRGLTPTPPNWQQSLNAPTVPLVSRKIETLKSHSAIAQIFTDDLAHLFLYISVLLSRFNKVSVKSVIFFKVNLFTNSTWKQFVLSW